MTTGKGSGRPAAHSYSFVTVPGMGVKSQGRSWHYKAKPGFSELSHAKKIIISFATLPLCPRKRAFVCRPILGPRALVHPR